MSETKEELSSENNEKVVFKNRRGKCFKRRVTEPDEEVDDTTNIKSLQEIKERQKIRKRATGVSVFSLGVKGRTDESSIMKEPLNKGGGLLNMQTFKEVAANANDDVYDVGIGTQFSVETNKRDEDEEMMKFIEKELQKRKGKEEAKSEPLDHISQQYMTPEEAALCSLPEYLQQTSSHRSEEMLSNQMLNGIPEVDLGILAKIKNIEATEDAKQKLVKEQQKQKDMPSQFVPTNMAVNFSRHNRFTIDDNGVKLSNSVQKTDWKPNNNSNANIKKSTDDYHYDKFRKQFNRY